MNTAEEKIRVLIADDSFFIRRYLSELFEQSDDIEVVGAASDGEEVISLARTLKPDVITMDYHMPKKNGIEATAAIMLGERPLPAIIMLSAFDGKDGERVRRSLLLSGAEVLIKPSGEVSLDIERTAGDILTRVRQVGKVELKMKQLYRRVHGGGGAMPVPMSRRSRSDKPFVLVLGASTGGPPLVEHLLSVLRASDNIAIIIVQHMSRYFTELFAERLDRVTEFTVREAVDGDIPVPGTALVVPGGMFLELGVGDEGESLGGFLVKKSDGPHETEIDKTMEAVARFSGERTCGVLLSGMGADGSLGMRKIKEFGGRTIVQDPEDAAVSSMPRSALHGGDIDSVLPADEIPEYIRQLVAK